MRILNILCGVSVLFVTLGYGHLVHHFLTHSPHESYGSPLFWAAMLAAIAAGILSFLGGLLLLKRLR